MSDKPVAGITTAIIALPLVILCCLGPAFLFAGVGGLIGWLGGANIFLAVAVAMAIVAGIAVNRLLRRKAGGPRTSDATDLATDQLEDETGEGIKDWPIASAGCPTVLSETPAKETQLERSATAAAVKSRYEHMVAPAFLQRSSSAPTNEWKPIRSPQSKETRSEPSRPPRRNGR